MFSVILFLFCHLGCLSKAIVHRPAHRGNGLCNVTNLEGPQKNQPCVLPFIFEGDTFQECQCVVPVNDTFHRECRSKTEKVDKKRFWCSTKVDENGTHISGGNNYGYCDINCASERTILESDTTTIKTSTATTYFQVRLNAATPIFAKQLQYICR